jgi:hypothetical protein
MTSTAIAGPDPDDNKPGADLVAYDPNLYAQWIDEDDGLGNVLEVHGVQVPRIRSNMKSGGGYEDELDGTVWTVHRGKKAGEYVSDTLPVTFLYMQAARTWWEKQMTGDATSAPDCRSDDGLVATPDSRFAGRRCADCPLSQWSEDEAGKSIKPPCRPSTLALVFNHQTERPGVIRFTGGAQRRLDKYASTFKLTSKRKLPPIFAVKTNITLEVVADDYDSHLEPVFAIAEGLPPEMVGEIVDLRQQIGGRKALAAANEMADRPVDQAGPDPFAEPVAALPGRSVDPSTGEISDPGPQYQGNDAEELTF